MQYKQYGNSWEWHFKINNPRFTALFFLMYCGTFGWLSYVYDRLALDLYNSGLGLFTEGILGVTVFAVISSLFFIFGLWASVSYSRRDESPRPSTPITVQEQIGEPVPQAPRSVLIITSVMVILISAVFSIVFTKLANGTRDKYLAGLNPDAGYMINLSDYPFRVKAIESLNEKGFGSVSYCWVTEVKDALRSESDPCQMKGMLFLFKIFIEDKGDYSMIVRLGSKDGRYYYLFHYQDYQEYFDNYPGFRLPSFDAIRDSFVVL